MKTVEELIDDAWAKLFENICDLHNDDMHDLKIEYQERTTGKTIIRSWKDREKRLQE